jgi:HlyD family secretion protein
MKTRKWLLLTTVIVAGVVAYIGWRVLQPRKLPDGFASSNGRIEAVEIDAATKTPGRLLAVLVDEGDFVTAGQVLAQMDTDVLDAQLREANAERQRAKTAVETAQSKLAQRETEKAAAESVVLQREAELDNFSTTFDRKEGLVGKGGVSGAEVNLARANFYSAKAAVSIAKSNVAGAEAAVTTAKSEGIQAEATVEAAQARIERIQADIKDSVLKSPRDGRVQFRIAQPGEVLSAGGKVLTLVDLADVYMTFFLPTDWAGRVQLGAEVRLVLDAAPQFVIPAKITFVADVAQFTPKTVETAEERQKLTFRVKAHIPPELLKKYPRDIKTGLPGMAYVQLNPQASWPTHLEVKLPE